MKGRSREKRLCSMYSDDQNKAPLHLELWWDSLHIGKRYIWVTRERAWRVNKAIVCILRLDDRWASTSFVTCEANEVHKVQLLALALDQPVRSVLSSLARLTSLLPASCALQWS
jgi:hypothetical protein